MSKVDDNKKQKESTLLETAFHLFTGKGFAKTTISDIVQQAGLAKGTFYYRTISKKPRLHGVYCQKLIMGDI